MSDWCGEERRRTPQMTLAELEMHIDNRIKIRLDEHAHKEEQRMKEQFDELKELLRSGFPGGDPEEHRRYHQEVIEFMQERRQLWRSIREKTLTGLVWAGAVGLGTMIWHYVKAKLGSP